MRGTLEVKKPVMGPSAAAENHNSRAYPGSSTPSLLQRLSDPIDISSFDADAVRNTTSTPVFDNYTPAASREDSTDESDPKGKRVIKMSAPEIMARTRARLARIKAEPAPPSNSTKEHRADRVLSNNVRDVHDVSTRETPTPDTTSLKPGPALFPISTPFDPSSPSLNLLPSSSPPSTINSRARLLSKLEDEKRLYRKDSQGNEGDLLTNTTPPIPHIDASGVASPVAEKSPQTKAPDPNPLGQVAPEMKEAKLRSQAQLRVRLAAARRIAVGNVEESSGGGAREDSGSGKGKEGSSDNRE